MTVHADLRMAIATCLLEHLLEYRFDRFVARFEEHARSDARFADAVSHCAQFGQASDAARADKVSAPDQDGQRARRSASCRNQWELTA